jgi:hypothetical protein
MIRYVFSLVLLAALLSWGYADEISPQSAELISVETVSDSHPGEMVPSERVEVLEQFQMELEAQKDFACSASCLSVSSREVSIFMSYKKVAARINSFVLPQYTEEGIGVGWTWYGPPHQFFMS